MKDLLPHQQRVIDERQDLDGKIDRLSSFTETSTFAVLDPAERSRMERQLRAMVGYRNILDERIAAF